MYAVAATSIAIENWNDNSTSAPGECVGGWTKEWYAAPVGLVGGGRIKKDGLGSPICYVKKNILIIDAISRCDISDQDTRPHRWSFRYQVGMDVLKLNQATRKASAWLSN